MSKTIDNPQPELAGPQLARSGAAILPALVVAGSIMASLWIFADRGGPASVPSQVPLQLSELGPGIVTPIDPNNGAAVAAAIAKLRLSEAQRDQFKQDVLAGSRRLGWIVFMDSMDEDGDVIAVEAGGIVQHVALTKAWIPVAVPLDSGRVVITGVHDGGGGITVAVATRSGPTPLRILLPGESIEVATP